MSARHPHDPDRDPGYDDRPAIEVELEDEDEDGEGDGEGGSADAGAKVKRSGDDVVSLEGWGRTILDRVPWPARIAAALVVLTLVVTAIVVQATRPKPDPFHLAADTTTVTVADVDDGLDVRADITNSGPGSALILKATYLGPGLAPEPRPPYPLGSVPAGGHTVFKIHSLFQCPESLLSGTGPTSITVTVATGPGKSRDIVLPLPADTEQPWPKFTQKHADHCRQLAMDELTLSYVRIGTPADPATHRFTVLLEIHNHGADENSVTSITQPYRGATTEIAPAPPSTTVPGKPPYTVAPGATVGVAMTWTITDCAIVPRHTAQPFLDVTAFNLVGQDKRSEILDSGYVKDLNAQIDAACP